jgi:hypothetical protein
VRLLAWRQRDTPVFQPATRYNQSSGAREAHPNGGILTARPVFFQDRQQEPESMILSEDARNPDPSIAECPAKSSGTPSKLC